MAEGDGTDRADTGRLEEVCEEIGECVAMQDLQLDNNLLQALPFSLCRSPTAPLSACAFSFLRSVHSAIPSNHEYWDPLTSSGLCQCQCLSPAPLSLADFSRRCSRHLCHLSLHSSCQASTVVTAFSAGLDVPP